MRAFLNHILGGWQIAATYEFQPEPLLAWGNVFCNGHISKFEEDATSGTKTLDEWFNTSVPIERLADLHQLRQNHQPDFVSESLLSDSRQNTVLGSN
jgi:hypothetical protein